MSRRFTVSPITASSILEGFLTKYRNLNTHNRLAGEQIDAILDKYADNDGTDYLEKLYRRCSEEDKARIAQIFDANPTYGSIEYVRHQYQKAKKHLVENPEYSDGIVDAIGMLVAAGLIRQSDVE